MRFVSFATPDYHLEASSLIQSLEAHGLDYHVALLPKRGRWVENCARKPGFMLDIWRSHESLCWVDADARVVRQPPPMDWDADVAVHRFEGQIASGTVWVSGDKGGQNFLRQWKRLCEADNRTWDQRHVEAAVKAAGARFHELPAEWCYIYDLSRKHWPDARPIIEHYQASRRLRGQGRD